MFNSMSDIQSRLKAAVAVTREAVEAQASKLALPFTGDGGGNESDKSSGFDKGGMSESGAESAADEDAGLKLERAQKVERKFRGKSPLVHQTCRIPTNLT